MRLIIRSRQGVTAGGLRRYNGSGIFSSIGRKLFSSGRKKVINVAAKANLPQKIANVVVNGAQSAGKKLGKAVGEKLGTVVRKGVKRKLAPVQQTIPLKKHSKVDINRLIDGSGIVFD